MVNIQSPIIEIGKESMKDIPYAYVVGSLMYSQYVLVLIVYLVIVLGRFQSKLKIIHWKVAKRLRDIFNALKLQN